jgi:WD40 repeat protein
MDQNRPEFMLWEKKEEEEEQDFRSFVESNTLCTHISSTSLPPMSLVLVNHMRMQGSDAWAYSFTSDGLHLATGLYDNNIARLWDAATGECVFDFHGHAEPVRACSLSADGRLLATGSEDKTARVWDAAKGKCLHVLYHAGPVRACGLSADGRLLATGSTDGTVRLWIAKTGKCVAMFADHAGCRALCIGEKHLCCAWDSGDVSCFDISSY